MSADQPASFGQQTDRIGPNQLRELFDRMDEGFCVIEFIDGPNGPLDDYVHIAANAAYTINAGIPNVVGQKLRTMVPDEADSWLERYGHVLRTGEPIRFEQELIATGRVLELSAFRLGPAEDRLVAVLFKDVTARRLAEDELRRLNETLEMRVVEEMNERRAAEAALQQSQKMEAIGQLTGGIAHDFNNLLQIIIGNLNLLQPELPDNERVQRRITNAMTGVDRAAKLASQLLAFGRRQPLEPRVINVGRLVASMEELLHRTIGEEITVETLVSPDLWNAIADPAQVENAILNLAINARDAMNGPGKLTVAVRNVALDSAYSAQNPDSTPGDYVLLEVSDTGCGIPADVLGQVFDPFFTTKSEGRGSGLGLSMVYGFVKQSGGHVVVNSEPGAGTTVQLYLPRILEQEDRAAEPTQDSAAAAGGSETILVVEDDESLRATVADLLTELGYDVLVAGSADEAATIVGRGSSIDLLFTDVVMPGKLRSPELAQLARAQMPGIAILFTSGYAENAIVHGGRVDPGVDLLPKPYSRETLAGRIRAALDKARAASVAG